MLDRCQDSRSRWVWGRLWISTYYCGLFVMCMVTLHSHIPLCFGYWLKLLNVPTDLLPMQPCESSVNSSVNVVCEAIALSNVVHVVTMETC